jgi:hypothetical protein
MQFQTQYRVLKTSWGIAIDISGTLEETTTEESSMIISETHLSSVLREQLIMGLESILSDKETVRRKYTIDIQAVSFNFCDFQTDSLFWASRDWLAKALNIKVAEPEIIYDKVENKYFFNR